MNELPLVDAKAPRFEGDKVIRTAKYFEVGREFTDMNGRKFGISEAEADAILPTASAGSINIEHMPTVLDGMLGSVERYYREGKDIYAEFHIPKDLHSLTKGKPIKISSEWDVETKQPLGAAFVLAPAVKDAVMMAAFKSAKFATSAILQMHDNAVRGGAECGGKSLFAEGAAKFMTPDELKTIQKVHDMCSGDGKHCDLYASRNAMYYSQPKTQARPNRAEGDRKPMKFIDAFKALFSKAGVPDEEIEAAFKDVEEPKAATTPPTPVAPAAKFAETAEYKEMQANVTALLAQNTALTAQFAEQQKVAQFKEDSNFIEGLVRQMRITPAEAERWRKTAQEQPVAFAAAKENLAAAPVRREIAREGLKVKMANASDPANQLTALAKQRAAEQKISFGEASRQIVAENPALAQAHSDNTPTVGNGGKE